MHSPPILPPNCHQYVAFLQMLASPANPSAGKTVFTRKTAMNGAKSTTFRNQPNILCYWVVAAKDLLVQDSRDHPTKGTAQV